jgi:hypothetical protein
VFLSKSYVSNILKLGDKMNCGEMIEELKKFPKDKPIKIMGWYSIAETDDPEDINSICYLQEVDIDTLEVTGKITDFVAIVSDKYHEIASEFP